MCLKIGSFTERLPQLLKVSQINLRNTGPNNFFFPVSSLTKFHKFYCTPNSAESSLKKQSY